MKSQELETLLDQLTETKSPVLAQQLLKELQNSIVILPAIMPPDTDPKILKQMREPMNHGEEAPLPKSANPRPCMLEDEQGKKLIPVFTSEKEIDKEDTMAKFPIHLNLPFGRCIQFVGQNANVKGIVVNPFSHNFRIDLNVKKKENVKNKNQIPNGQKITSAQFHALVREYVEANLIPKRLFQEKESFMQEIQNGGEEYLLQLFEPPYVKGQKCPYTVDDFDVMSLMIRDDLKIIQITMPSKHFYVGTCSKVFLVWNPLEQEVAYYAIVLRKDKHLILHQAFPDGTNQEISEAPAEGSELQGIIDLYS